MKIIKVDTYEEMSFTAAQLIIQKIQEKPNAVIGLATGSTPLGLYKELIQDHHNNGTSYKQIRTVNLDEYLGLPTDDQNSYHTFMKENLFQHIDIPEEQTHIPNGQTEHPEAEGQRYEDLIQGLGGVDLQILGIGHNGHIGFNEPGTSFDSRTKIVELANSTRKANARFFESMQDVPSHAITMGIASIMDSKEIILLASGTSKAEALQQLIMGEVTEDSPASSLKLHDNVIVIADKEALSLVDIEK